MLIMIKCQKSAEIKKKSAFCIRKTSNSLGSAVEVSFRCLRCYNNRACPSHQGSSDRMSKPVTINESGTKIAFHRRRDRFLQRTIIGPEVYMGVS